MMTMPSPIEQRGLSRRATDRLIDNLYTTYSSTQCHSCLQKHPDGIILLDQTRQVLFTNAHAKNIAAQSGAPFTFLPKFSLIEAAEARQMENFLNNNRKDSTSGPYSQLLNFIPPQSEDKLILLTYFKLPETSSSNTGLARYLLFVRDPSYFSIQQWKMLTEHFKLTVTETRLCHALADGLSIKTYCEKWRVTEGTARGQLHNIFNKTSTRRQSELIRLIFLFTRIYG